LQGQKIELVEGGQADSRRHSPSTLSVQLPTSYRTGADPLPRPHRANTDIWGNPPGTGEERLKRDFGGPPQGGFIPVCPRTVSPARPRQRPSFGGFKAVVSSGPVIRPEGQRHRLVVIITVFSGRRPATNQTSILDQTRAAEPTAWRSETRRFRRLDSTLEHRAGPTFPQPAEPAFYGENPSDNSRCSSPVWKGPATHRLWGGVGATGPRPSANAALPGNGGPDLLADNRAVLLVHEHGQSLEKP